MKLLLGDLTIICMPWVRKIFFCLLIFDIWQTLSSKAKYIVTKYVSSNCSLFLSVNEICHLSWWVCPVISCSWGRHQSSESRVYSWCLQYLPLWWMVLCKPFSDGLHCPSCPQKYVHIPPSCRSDDFLKMLAAVKQLLI